MRGDVVCIGMEEAGAANVRGAGALSGEQPYALGYADETGYSWRVFQLEERLPQVHFETFGRAERPLRPCGTGN